MTATATVPAPFLFPAEISVRLTPAERDIVRLVLTGRSNRDIAHIRGSSEGTIKHQLVSVYRKLGIDSRTRLMAIVLKVPEAPPLDCPQPLTV